jgi:ankyrin repeat protein
VVQTPLYIAVYFNSQPLTELLLKRGAHPDLPGPTGDTPMMAALQYEDRLELAKMLVAAGASIKKIDLGLVDTAETAQALIQQGANPQTLDIQLLQNNQKLLGWFLSQHPDLTDESADIAVTLTPETVDALLSAGMPTTISGTFDPFLILAIEKQEELVPVLLKHHADPEAKGSFDQTALCKAADTGKVASAKALLAAGAKVNANCSNKPPLWAAALSGNQELVDLLIQAGADPNAPVDGKLLLMEMIDDITFFDPGSQLFHGEGKIKVLGNLVARGYTFNVNGQNPCSYTRTKAAAPELIKAACPGSP